MKVWLKNIKFLPTAGNVRLNTFYCRKCETNIHNWNNNTLRALICCLKGQRVTSWKQHVCPKNWKQSNSVVGGAEGDLLLPLPCHGHGSSRHLSPDTDTPRCCSGEDGRAVTTGGPLCQQFLPVRKEYTGLHPAHRLVVSYSTKDWDTYIYNYNAREKNLITTTSALKFLCKQTLKRNELWSLCVVLNKIQVLKNNFASLFNSIP